MSGIVIVGAGQAGASLAQKLRALGYDGAVTLIGEEPVPPYERPPLSKGYLLGEQARERLFLRPEAIYAEKEIGLHLGAPVEAVDVVAKTVTVGVPSASRWATTVKLPSAGTAKSPTSMATVSVPARFTVRPAKV